MAWTCGTCKVRTDCMASVLQKRPDPDQDGPLEGFYLGEEFADARCENQLTYQPPLKKPRGWPADKTAVYQCIMRAELPLTQRQIEEQTGASRNCCSYYLQQLAADGYIYRREDTCRERRMYHWHSEIEDHHLPELMTRRRLMPQIVRMTVAGLSKKKIAAALGLGETQVFNYRREARALGLLKD